MRVRVLLFGSIREALGSKELVVSVADGASVADLQALLAEEHPVFERFGDHLAVAVNQETSDPGAGLRDGDEVAFLPPVSGGATAGLTTISEHPLDVGEVVKRVVGSDAGGIVTFVGAVRDRSRGRDIRHLEYEAYPAMAIREMDKIADAAAERWPGVRVAIAHRHGHLEIGDLAVVVVAAAPHRAEAFEACRFAIDTLKEKVPIWKKEVATDGEHWVDEHP